MAQPISTTQEWEPVGPDGRFMCKATPLSGLTLLRRQPISDHRGFFERLYCPKTLHSCGFDQPIKQVNRSNTLRPGTLRGMHFQFPPYGEQKFVQVLRGAIFDVAVDIRPYSPTFLQWYGETLSATNHMGLIIPQGFAHGFQTLTEDCELLYLHSEEYHPEAEGGLSPLDPGLSISWPLPIAEMSERDRQHPLLTADFSGITP